MLSSVGPNVSLTQQLLWRRRRRRRRQRRQRQPRPQLQRRSAARLVSLVARPAKRALRSFASSLALSWKLYGKCRAHFSEPLCSYDNATANNNNSNNNRRVQFSSVQFGWRQFTLLLLILGQPARARATHNYSPTTLPLSLLSLSLSLYRPRLLQPDTTGQMKKAPAEETCSLVGLSLSSSSSLVLAPVCVLRRVAPLLSYSARVRPSLCACVHGSQDRDLVLVPASRMQSSSSYSSAFLQPCKPTQRERERHSLVSPVSPASD